jgi:tight adherence protein C
MMLVCVEAGPVAGPVDHPRRPKAAPAIPRWPTNSNWSRHEVKAGKERVVVLKDMAERVGVPDVASFVTTLVQSATFGTSIAEACGSIPPTCATSA